MKQSRIIIINKVIKGDNTQLLVNKISLTILLLFFIALMPIWVFGILPAIYLLTNIY
ncbi:MAG: hypothetical protein Q7S37_04630 [bacterium]|nr:hypothetical protein [bacterium]